MPVSNAAVKPLNQTRVIPLPVRRTVVEAAKWRTLNTQLVVSYMGDCSKFLQQPPLHHSQDDVLSQNPINTKCSGQTDKHRHFKSLQSRDLVQSLFAGGTYKKENFEIMFLLP